MNKFTKLIGATALTLFAGSAMASSISGSIGFSGLFSIVDNGDDGFVSASPNFLQGDEIDIDTVGFLFGDGSFAGLGGEAITHEGFDYNPNTLTASASSNPLWTIGDFEFDLTNSGIDTISADSMIIKGFGTVTDTTGTLSSSTGSWQITLNNNGSAFTWSSSATVPAPAVAMLLGMGLLGFATTRKLRA